MKPLSSSPRLSSSPSESSFMRRTTHLSVAVCTLGALTSSAFSAQVEPHLFKKNAVPYSRFAYDVEPYGDYDLDGNGDLLVSSAAFFGPGHVQIVSGVNGRPLLTCADFDGRWWFGWAISTLDDVDNDGIMDFAVSARKVDPGDPVYKARVGAYSGATGARIWFFEAPTFDEALGFEIDSIGDQNGDGVRDLLVGSPNSSVVAQGAGAITVLSGLDGSVLRRIEGTTPSGSLGITVSRLGDVDGDGTEDYLAGASGVITSATHVGEVRTFSGTTGQVIGRVGGPSYADTVGAHCDDVGDVDGDGLPDFVMNSGSSNPFVSFGSVFVVSSSTNQILMTVRRPTLSGAGNVSLSRHAEGVGDANGDGRPDIAYGVTRNAGIGRLSKVRVVDALTGDLIFESEDLLQSAGSTVQILSRAGDLNGDGRDDVVCAIPDFVQHSPWSGVLLTYLAP